MAGSEASLAPPHHHTTTIMVIRCDNYRHHHSRYHHSPVILLVLVAGTSSKRGPNSRGSSELIVTGTPARSSAGSGCCGRQARVKK